MILDKELVISTAQAFTNSAGAGEVDLDLGAGGDAIGEEMYIVFRVGTAFTGGTSLKFSVLTDDNSEFSSAKTLLESGTILADDLTANTIVYKAKLPPGCERYLRAYVTPDGTFGGGTLDIFLTPQVEVRR